MFAPLAPPSLSVKLGAAFSFALACVNSFLLSMQAFQVSRYRSNLSRLGTRLCVQASCPAFPSFPLPAFLDLQGVLVSLNLIHLL